MKIKNKLNSFYLQNYFFKHTEIKNDLLNLIKYSNYSSPKAEIAEVDISKTDWNFCENMQRDWVKFIKDDLFFDIKKMFLEANFFDFSCNQIWFQQYFKNSQHGWHTHGCNFTGIYYLDLPLDSPKTILIEPYDLKTKINVNIKEGDILIFPSYVLHKAPKNQSNRSKTIISFNMDVKYLDEFYGKNFI
jgi:hypothetical protein